MERETKEELNAEPCLVVLVKKREVSLLRNTDRLRGRRRERSKRLQEVTHSLASHALIHIMNTQRSCTPQAAPRRRP